MAKKENVRNKWFHGTACHVGPESIHDLISLISKLHTCPLLIETKLILKSILVDVQSLLGPKGKSMK